ncbi:probable BOI-related E3 ubiquitin-protein ligase 3 isoform X1 [Typha latifolia]|uniref:probable BOI-related E3 ubiquitin-protein ligase 3 isoform X1 n=1 Tax=Typha latifolia TaxID=4733 RepID=UPI003C2B6DC6
MDFSQPPSRAIFFSNGEASPMVMNQLPLVSTGLHLSFGEHQHGKSQSDLVLSSVDEFTAQINRHRDEIDRFIHAQGEQLRRALAERRRSHYRALLCAAEAGAGRRMREKEAELEKARRHAAELEERLARLKAESMAWQAKALSEQAAAAALRAQLQEAAEECVGESSPAEDAESAHVDPGRVCWGCRTRPASVVLFPCRHLCLCDSCEVGREYCPVCRSIVTGSIHVFLP